MKDFGNSRKVLGVRVCGALLSFRVAEWFHKVYIFSNSLHTIKKKIKLPDEQLIHGFSAESLEQVLEAEAQEENELEEGEEPNRILFIFDDNFLDDWLG